jgi:hypothetical protein
MTDAAQIIDQAAALPAAAAARAQTWLWWRDISAAASARDWRW